MVGLATPPAPVAPLTYVGLAQGGARAGQRDLLPPPKFLSYQLQKKVLGFDPSVAANFRVVIQRALDDLAKALSV